MPRITAEIVVELRERLLEAIPGSIKEVVVAMHAGDPEPPTTPQGKELNEGVETVCRRLQRELMAFERVFDGDRFQGRIHVYSRREQEKSGWALTQMEYAGSRVMGGEPEQLKSLAEHLLEDEDEHSFALWMTAIPGPGGAAIYFLYARHSSGEEMAYLLHSGNLRRLPLNPEQLNLLLGTVSPVLSLERGYWKRVLTSLGELATSEFRADVQKYFKETLQVELADAHWAQLIKHFYLNLDFLRFQMEVGRSVGTPVLQEAQALLTSLVEGLERASAMFDERLEQAKRDHRRELKRRITEFDKLNAAYKGLVQRAQRQSEEIIQLSRTAKANGTSAGPSNGGVHSLGRTLQQFF